jgi:hypothetical protein
MLNRPAGWIIAAIVSRLLFGCSSGAHGGAGGAGSSGGSGGGGGSNGDAPPVPDSSFVYCPKQHAGQNAMKHPVIICDEMFSTRPYVHLPADDVTGPTVTVYVGISNSSEAGVALSLTDRRGKRYVGTDAKGGLLSTASPPAPMPPGLEMPSTRGMFTVYAVTATVGDYKPSWSKTPFPAMAVAEAAPEVTIPGEVIDARSERAWEGTISAREVKDGVASWNDKKPLPLRIEFTKMTHAKNLTAWDTATVTEADGATYALAGRVTNLNDAVTDSTGKCLPAFSSLGESNSFFGATDDIVTSFRLGSMHSGGDEELVLTYPEGVGFGMSGGMGNPAVCTPINFIQTDDDPRYDSVDLHPHGLGFGNVITIHPVMGKDLGGEKCHPG